MKFECPSCQHLFSYFVTMNGKVSLMLTLKEIMVQLAGIMVCPKCHARIYATEEAFWKRGVA